MARDRAGEIGEKDERAFQHADQMHAVRMIARDLGREGADPLLDLLGGNERLHALSHEVRKGNIANLVKRFQMVTEADARVLEYGSTIVLVTGGHITPLAQDTLKARRISVVREGADPDASLLAPAADIRTVAIAGDHSAVALKTALVQHLRGRGIAVHDLGTATSDPVDYPDTAAAAAVHNGRASR